METLITEYRNIRIYESFPGLFFYTKTYGRVNQFKTLRQIKKFIDKKLS